MRRTILALGGHGFGSGPSDRAVSELLLRLARERSGGRPRICLLAMPGEEASARTAAFYSRFGDRACDPTDLPLARLGRRRQALRDQLLAQDLVYVTAPSDAADLPALWRACELDSLLARAWSGGTVLAGDSHGATCWFEAGLAGGVASTGLGLLGGSLCVGYDRATRRAVYLDAVRAGMPDGFAVDGHAALLWEGTGPPQALTAKRGARAWRIAASGEGVVEEPVAARLLPAPAPAVLREDIAEFRRIAAMRRRAGWLG